MLCTSVCGVQALPPAFSSRNKKGHGEPPTGSPSGLGLGVVGDGTLNSGSTRLPDHQGQRRENEERNNVLLERDKRTINSLKH